MMAHDVRRVVDHDVAKGQRGEQHRNATREVQRPFHVRFLRLRLTSSAATPLILHLWRVRAAGWRHDAVESHECEIWLRLLFWLCFLVSPKLNRICSVTAGNYVNDLPALRTQTIAVSRIDHRPSYQLIA